jgi:hypothetical protein
MLIRIVNLGLYAPSSRDEYLHVAHRTIALYNEAEALYFHLGESTHSEASVWHES